MTKSLMDFPSVKKYLTRIEAEPRSMLTAVVKKQFDSHYYTDIAIIKFSKSGEVETSNPAYDPTDEEATLIKAELSEHEWPHNVPFSKEDAKNVPMIKHADPKNVYWFANSEGQIIMAQIRRENKDGTRNYFPLTKWSDGEFRHIEPEDKLPLWGQEQLKDHTTVFISEGVKSAKYGKDIADGKIDHPWKEELSNAAHLGYVGGALAPHRTDWSILKQKGVTRVIIIADNDAPGLEAVPKIAKEIDCVTMSLEFTDQFKRSCDIADPFPDHLFKQTSEGLKVYRGPSFFDCLHPSTWMTDEYHFLDDKGKVKKAHRLRLHAARQWAYIDEIEEFCNVEFPNLRYKAEVLDKRLMAFSHVKKTSDLLLSSYGGRTTKLAYRPDLKGRRVNSRGQTAINTYMPPNIKPMAGDATPWHDYINYLCPKENEAHELKRWCATLIARPDVRLLYAVLLISEQTGIGKSTLGEKILAPLVGFNNTSFPNEETVTNQQFTEWISEKRLAIVNELYCGASFKAANALKDKITDNVVRMNKKYKAETDVENFISIFSCSNSLKALLLDNNDRRWFIPSVAEKPWSLAEYGKFFDWLNSGGLQIIYHWALSFDDYVKPGERAPMTDRKRQMIREGFSEAMEAFDSLLMGILNEGDAVAIPLTSAFEWAKQKQGGRIFDKKSDFARHAANMGFGVWNKDSGPEARVYFEKRPHPVVVSPTLLEAVKDMSLQDARNKVSLNIKHAYEWESEEV